MKKYTIRDKDGVEEYYVIKNGLKYSLHYSHNSVWSNEIRGKFILSVEDTSNEYVWKGEKNLNKYEQADCVKILLRFIQQDDYKIYEETLTEL